MIGRVLAGVQAGFVTLAFILAAVLGSAPQGATFSGIPVWSIYAVLIAGLCALAARVLRGRGPLTIAATIIIVGLICEAMYLTCEDFYPKHVGDIMVLAVGMGLAGAAILLPLVTLFYGSVFPDLMEKITVGAGEPVGWLQAELLGQVG